MERIASFCVDHLRLEPGVYISRKDEAPSAITQGDTHTDNQNNHTTQSETKIGIIGAMEVEIAYLKDEMSTAPVSTTTRAGMTFYSGYINSQSVVLCMCKVGKVNAAICAQIMCDIFGVTHIINTGVAGSLDTRIDIGDIVISTNAIQHDIDVHNFGYEYGQVPGLEVIGFESDKKLRDMAIQAVKNTAPNIKAFEGTVLSGDQFVRDNGIKKKLKHKFNGLCCEMEGAAIAQAAYLNGVPFVIVRAISDKADDSDSESYEVFEKKAAKHCAHIIKHMLECVATSKE